MSSKSKRNALKVDLGIPSMLSLLEEEEKKRDKIIAASRPLIRLCSLAIKRMHSGEIAEAKKELLALDKALSSLPLSDPYLHNLFDPILQEMVEAKVLLAAIERKPIPSYSALKVRPAVYLLGLCDAIGEFRRAMLESMRQGKNKDAHYFFDLMSQIYDQLSLIRFSSSLIPNFKPKQDAARHALEQARSEILRAL
jgi:translin